MTEYATDKKIRSPFKVRPYEIEWFVNCDRPLAQQISTPVPTTFGKTVLTVTTLVAVATNLHVGPS
jgi:hypothetical protein